jgi:RimJ/RimL family protein N-acetyltransferase
MSVCAIDLPADNERGLRVAAKLGYREFARGHDAYYHDGLWVDQVSLRFDRSVWDERWGATEREYSPIPERA